MLSVATDSGALNDMNTISGMNIHSFIIGSPA